MSLSSLALRLAAIYALNPNPGDGPFPTSAGNRVYDSRIDPVEGSDDLASIEGKPLIIVYTEETNVRPYGAPADRYPVGELFVDLVVEIMVAVKGTVEIDTPDGQTTTYGTIEAPITDAQHEATLNVLEAIVGLLLSKPNRQGSAAPFWQVAMECRAVHSVPHRATDRDVRLAARTLKFEVKLKKEVWAPGAAAGALPEPVASVAAALPAGSSGALLLGQVARSIPAIPGPGAPSAIFQIFGGVGRQPTQTDFDVQGQVLASPPA